jgi:hypothetical protein
MHASNKAREQRFHGEIATYLSPPPREPSLCTSFGTRRGLAWAPTALNVIVNAPASHRKLLRVSTGDQDGGAQVRVRPHRDVRPRRPGDDFFRLAPASLTRATPRKRSGGSNHPGVTLPSSRPYAAHGRTRSCMSGYYKEAVARVISYSRYGIQIEYTVYPISAHLQLIQTATPLDSNIWTNQS